MYLFPSKSDNARGKRLSAACSPRACACSTHPSKASSSRLHSLGVLSNTYFDNYDAASSAARCGSIKLCARALIGMLMHGDGSHIINIDAHNLSKVCADFSSASTASVATLYC